MNKTKDTFDRLGKILELNSSAELQCRWDENWWVPVLGKGGEDGWFERSFTPPSPS
jgi:hypothetical protein